MNGNDRSCHDPKMHCACPWAAPDTERHMVVWYAFVHPWAQLLQRSIRRVCHYQFQARVVQNTILALRSCFELVEEFTCSSALNWRKYCQHSGKARKQNSFTISVIEWKKLTYLICNQQVLGLIWLPKLKIRGCDNVLLSQSYRKSQEALTGGYGAMMKW